MSRLRIAAVCAMAVALIGGAAWMKRQPPEAQRPAPGARPAPPPPPAAFVQDLPDPPAGRPLRIELLGVVHSDASDTLSSRMPARIVAVPVHEGDAVRKGQLLVQLDDSDARAQEQTAIGAVNVAAAQARRAAAGRDAQRVKLDSDILVARDELAQALNKQRQAMLARDAAVAELNTQRAAAQSAVSKAEAALKRATDSLKGLEELSSVGGVSRSDLAGARLQASVAQSDLDSARSQEQALDAAPTATPGKPYRIALADEDIAAAASGVQAARQGIQTASQARRSALESADQEVSAALAAVSQAQSGVAAARIAEAQCRLTAAISGIAASVSAHAGDTAQPGMPLVTVVSVGGLYAEALVPARQLSALREGEPATVSVDTRAAGTFRARVQSIAKVAEPDGRTFRVRFALLDPAALHPGQTARISVGEPHAAH